MLTHLQKVIKAVTPANPGSGSGTGAGVQSCLFFLDSGFRRNDRRGYFLTSYGVISIDGLVKSLQQIPILSFSSVADLIKEIPFLYHSFLPGLKVLDVIGQEPERIVLKQVRNPNKGPKKT
jgi:hypothetical protein